MESDKIAKLRKKLGWSQSEMARAIGLAHPMTVSQWENNHSVPSGVTERFLRLLSSLSDSELQKIARRLEEMEREEPRVKK